VKIQTTPHVNTTLWAFIITGVFPTVAVGTPVGSRTASPLQHPLAALFQRALTGKLRKFWRDIVATVGITKQIVPHQFRHSFDVALVPFSAEIRPNVSTGKIPRTPPTDLRGSKRGTNCSLIPFNRTTPQPSVRNQDCA